MSGQIGPAERGVRSAIRFTFRGKVETCSDFRPYDTLLDWLRVRARAVGTKEGCGEGDCGACTVVLVRTRDGRVRYEPINACILLLGQVDGAELITVEDLGSETQLHPVQEALVALHGSQCGFCTPGIVMSLYALYQQGGAVSREAVCDQLAGNLCRCTGYRPIVDAAVQACAATRLALEARRDTPAALQDLSDVFVGDDSRFFAIPASEDSLAALYAKHPDALILAGATDVGLWITKGLQEPQQIIWIGGVAGFDGIDDTGKTVAMFAGATHAAAAPFLEGIHADLGPIMRRFGSQQVRASGTVGGSIANASPIGDLAPCLIALGASLELRVGDITRTLALEDFFIAYREQDRQPGEYVRRIVVPKLPTGDAFRAFKISKRLDEDISSVLAAFRFTIEGRLVVAARIAYGGMAATPKRAKRCEAACAGLDLDDTRSWSGAIDSVRQDFSPLSDHRASAAYRALVAGNLLRKALLELQGADVATTRLDIRGLVHAG